MSSVTKKWTEEDFRRELRRLDRHVRDTQGVDLVGGELEIAFSQSRYTLGMYHSRQKKFTFSLAFFNSDVPEQCALDVIRHEYAHYYNHAVFGVNHGHGIEFKSACIIVGAFPNTYYSKTFESFARNAEADRAKTRESRVKTGQVIKHPAYGMGKVISQEPKGNTVFLKVEFPKVGVKTIDEAWLESHGML